MMEFYITLRSDDSLLLYPTNSTTHFRVELDGMIHMDDRWMLGLSDITINSTKQEDLYICSTVCQDSHVGSGKMPLLRRICAKFKQFSFQNIHYIPVRMCELKTVDIYIKDRSGEFPSFVEGTVVITLHFKRLPYLL